MEGINTPPIQVTQKLKYDFLKVVINAVPANGRVARVFFNVTDIETGEQSTVFAEYKDQEFNTWWQSFNTAQFLISDGLRKLGVDISVSSDVDQQILNS